MVQRNQLEKKVIDVALTRLLSCQSDQLVPFKWRQDGGKVVSEGSSIRYSMIALIGLLSAVTAGMLEPDVAETARRWRVLKGYSNQIMNYGDFGLFLFLAALWADRGVCDLSAVSWQRLQAALTVKNNPHETMWLSWLLDGLCAAARVMPENASLPEYARRTAATLLANQDAESGLFYRTRNWSGPVNTLKGRISFFCDQVYPIHAFSSAHVFFKEPAYLDSANRCAEKLVQTQGAAGEWWWIYNIPRGTVAEPFPVYSVHQHGMAPMALRRLRQAGGLDYEDACSKGIGWLNQNNVRDEMVEKDIGLIWRSQRRAHFAGIVTSCNQITSSFGFSPRWKLTKELRIDRECRPYELGWLLYAASLKDG